MKSTHVRALLKEHGYKSKHVKVKQEDGFLRVSCLAAPYSLQYDGRAVTEIPNGLPTIETIKELIAASSIEETQTVQVDYMIGDGVFSAYWKWLQ